MFSIQDSKRIRRQDLLRENSDDENERNTDINVQYAEEREALAAKLREKLAQTLAIDIEPPPAPRNKKSHPDPTDDVMEVDGEEQVVGRHNTKQEHPLKSTLASPVDQIVQPDEVEEPEFEFRLFQSTNVSTKIKLDPLKIESNLLEEPRSVASTLVRKKRPLSFYLSSEPTAREAQRLAVATITPEQILRTQKQRWWGKEMPWKIVAHLQGTTPKEREASGIVASTPVSRVTVSSIRVYTQGDNVTTISNITTTTTPSSPFPNTETEGEKMKMKKKARPSKKMRITKRTRLRAIEEKKKEEAKVLEEKEELIRQKKQRLNRAKKLRRKAKKQQSQQPGEGGQSSDSEAES